MTAREEMVELFFAQLSASAAEVSSSSRRFSIGRLLREAGLVDLTEDEDDARAKVYSLWRERFEQLREDVKTR